MNDKINNKNALLEVQTNIIFIMLNYNLSHSHNVALGMFIIILIAFK